MNISEITWSYCQINSGDILNSGLTFLYNQESYHLTQSFEKFFGNYLISDLSGKCNYIGEAKDISKIV